MLPTKNSRWLAVAAALLCLASVAFPCVIRAQSTEPADTFQVSYFSNANSNRRGNPGIRQEVRIINPGAYAPSYPPSDLCAMIYVINNDQIMQECCGCLISADGLLELSLSQNLTNNPFTGIRPNDGDIKIVSAVPNDNFGGVACDPTGGGRLPNDTFALNILPTPDLRAWSTHLQSDGNTTEDEFQQATLSAAELESLQEECYGIANVGSGFGVCAKGVNSASESCN